MTAPDLDVIGVGNAIVDVLAECDDAFLATRNIPKGGMVLIDEARARAIYAAMAPSVEVSGGSAANSIACVASLGGRAGFVGKVADDPLGEIFRHDLKSLGVAFETRPLKSGPATGRCLVNVTPDAQRSMTTFLGAAAEIAEDDVKPAFIERGAIVFFEGYLFEQPAAQKAFAWTCAIARAAGRKTALTLSDPGVVERQYGVLTAFIPQHVDILLANEKEAVALFGGDDLDETVARAREMCPLTAITRSEKGSVLAPRDGEAVAVEAVAPERLVDTTGAGDAYAAGLLYGIARDMGLAEAGRLGALCASEVIAHVGARPRKSLNALAAAAELL